MESRQPITSFIDYLKFEKRYSRHTITSYETDLLSFFDFLAVNYNSPGLESISHAQIRSWLAQLKENGLQAKSINRKISALKSFFKYNLKTGAIETSPMGKVISPKNGKRLPFFVKEEDVANLMQSMALSTEDWKSLNARVLISVFYATGMRLSELILLKEKQIDLVKGQIKVLGKGNKERIIPLGKEVQEIIKDYTVKDYTVT